MSYFIKLQDKEKVEFYMNLAHIQMIAKEKATDDAIIITSKEPPTKYVTHLPYHQVIEALDAHARLIHTWGK